MGHNYSNQAQSLKPQTPCKTRSTCRNKEEARPRVEPQLRGTPVSLSITRHRRFENPPPVTLTGVFTRTEIMLSADDEESLTQSHLFNETNRIQDQRFKTGINHLQSNLRPLIYPNQGKRNRSEGKRGETVER
ncbi:hypothetical protein F2Q69_00055670 [Brassica cretica]|uniref:Uncharacterized protein n=1 Tax=Brassica cretica TaxID=69181 RepID=A0A8S9NA86_BRACR|nr:hypothetical protein F2Q69_00055670 [Brassica cretica]